MATIPVSLITSGTIIVACIATLWDLKTNRIPNLITLPAIVFGLILNLYYSGLPGLGDALAGTVAGILILIIPFAFRGIGAGDVKLLAAIGALNGVFFLFHAFLYSAIAGGVIALGVAVARRKLYPILINIYFLLSNLANLVLKRGQQQQPVAITSGIKFPYGIAFLAGIIIAYWNGVS